jgi:hypothetical protein
MSRNFRRNNLMLRSFLFVISLSTLLNPFVSVMAYCQEGSFETKVGLSASLQANQFDIMVPIWGSDHFAISPAFGVVWANEGGSDIHLGLVPRFFFHKNKVAPYVGARIGFLIAAPKGGESTTDVITGVAFGGEYFLDEYFSFGVESQINVTISSEKSARFGNPGKANLNTAAAVFATVYF